MAEWVVADQVILRLGSAEEGLEAPCRSPISGPAIRRRGTGRRDDLPHHPEADCRRPDRTNASSPAPVKAWIRLAAVVSGVTPFIGSPRHAELVSRRLCGAH